MKASATGGTPLYMPPEMFKLKPEPSDKCDVYAFGISNIFLFFYFYFFIFIFLFLFLFLFLLVLWELYCEKVPFDGKYAQIHQLVDAVLNKGERPVIPEHCPKKLK